MQQAHQTDSLSAALSGARIPITELSPAVDAGAFPAKAFQGEVIPFAATVFREGHERIAVSLLLTGPEGQTTRHPMRMPVPGTDRFICSLRLDRLGMHRFQVEAWADDWATWQHHAGIKLSVGQEVELTLAQGAALLQRAADEAERPESERTLLGTAAQQLRSTGMKAAARYQVATAAAVQQALAERPLKRLTTLSEAMPIEVERLRAGHGAWYELFPRSEGAVQAADGSWTSGTFRTAAGRLPAIAAMGFDVVYLPPIHPIGLRHRKGPNNTLQAGPGDPGSPWAIGAASGGHDAIHPELGDLEDFAAFVSEAERHGLEIALDLALQASPDHPWVMEHPEWFTTRADGSIAFAENPPKQYQDIYPLNFDDDPDGLGAEVLRIVLLWIERGVRIFRVDNPHTKPLAFWQWLITKVRRQHPETVFLAEAFTRPPMLHALAKAGFQQSYNYFAWRNTRAELEEYLGELTRGTDAPADKPRGSADFLRPALWVNTPDILTEYLQFGGRAAYKIRAAIAATAAPIWGMYSGYELIENVARPGSEENLDNEKYQYAVRDWDSAEREGRSIAGYLSRLNELRRSHPALGQLRNLRLHHSDDEAVLVYSKHLDGRFTPDGIADTVIVVANVDPHSVRETTVHLDLAALSLEPGSVFTVREELTGQQWQWSEHAYVRLDPLDEPVHVLSVMRSAGPARKPVKSVSDSSPAASAARD